MGRLADLGTDTAVNIFRTMTRIAACDQRIQQGLAAGDLQFQYYPCGGQEAIPAVLAQLITKDDFAVTTYRGIHDIVAKGTPMREIMAEMYGRGTGTSKGKGGPMHLSDPQSGLMVTTGIVGSGAPIANGLALAEQIVRRQNIWRNSRGRLAERWPRLGVDIRRRACGVASADVGWSLV